MLNYKNSKLTVELGDLVKSGFDPFNFDYPSYYTGDEKTAFEQKIIDHYYFRQIGQETPERFRHYLKCKMREIMPYYIQRYESVAIMAAGIASGEINPLENYSMIEEGTTEDASTATRTGTGTTESTGSGNTSVTGSGNVSNTINSTEKFSDTPQNNLSNLDNYLTNATIKNNTESSESGETKTGTQSETNTAETTETSTEENTGNGKHTLTRRGNIGVTTYAQMLQGYRDSFINVDIEIIEELNCLFLGVY